MPVCTYCYLDEDIEHGEVPAGVPPHQILDCATGIAADRGATGHVTFHFPPLLKPYYTCLLSVQGL